MISEGITPLLYNIPSYPEPAEIQWEDWKHQAARSFLCNFCAKKLRLGEVKADGWAGWRMQPGRGKALLSNIVQLSYGRPSLLPCSESEKKEWDILAIYILFQLCLSLVPGK